MNSSPSMELVNGHSSPWIRFVIRVLSIRGSTWFVLVLSLAATVVACRQAWHSERVSQRMRFEAEAADFKGALIERLTRYEQILQGVRGLFAASENVTAEEFRAYVNSLEYHRDYPGIVGLGYLERVDDDRLGSSNRDAPPSLASHAGRMVVRYVEPLESNRVALGLDLGADPEQRKTAARALATGTAKLSPCCVLPQSPDKHGAILYEAVFKEGGTAEHPEGGETRSQGWVFAAFHAADLMDEARKTTHHDLRCEVYDGDDPSAESLMSCSSSFGDRVSKRLSRQDTLAIFGRRWSVRIHASSAASRMNLLPVGLLGGGGAAISLLLFGITHSMATTGKRACSIAMDMTGELRKQEEALRKSEERLAMVIEGSNDGIWDWNVETNDVYFSPRWKSMLGYQDQEISNHLSAWEDLIHPDDRQRSLDTLKRYLAGEIPTYQLEHRLRHRDGSYRWVLARGVALRDSDGRPKRMAGSHVDLTELKRVEQDLLRTNRELHQSQVHLRSALDDLSVSHAQLERTQMELIQSAKLECVGTLAAGVAHEVKNPLQIILLGLDYLDQRLTRAGEDTIVTLRDMRDAAFRADAITRELLSFSKSTEFDPGTADLGQVLERSLWLLRTDLNRAGVRVEKRLAASLPAVSIDTPKIQQVIINVISNGLQAMNYNGTLVVTTRAGRLDRVLPQRELASCPMDPSDQVVALTIRDSGPGIPDDLLPRIFDPFFTTKAVGSGSGLGLSVVKKIMDLHRACIHIRNSPHGGAEVILVFATAPQPAAPPAGLVHRV